MGIEVYTKDCRALSDGELGEMADLSTVGQSWEAGLLSKEAERWVLSTQAYENGKLRGFVFSTLERIGGTPALVIGLACVARRRNRGPILRGLTHDQFHKTLMAFPDEDVVVAARVASPGAFEVFAGLADVRPWPDTRANGEERAWGRRLAKRYETVRFDDRAMVGFGNSDGLIFDHESLKQTDAAALFDKQAGTEDRHLVAWGWAMAEHLERFQKPAR